MRSFLFILLMLVPLSSSFSQPFFKHLDILETKQDSFYLITYKDWIDEDIPDKFLFDEHFNSEIRLLAGGSRETDYVFSGDRVAFWDNDPEKYIFLRSSCNVDCEIWVHSYTGSSFFVVGGGSNLIISKQDPAIVYVSTGGGTLVSEDSANNFVFLAYEDLLGVHPQNNAIMYAVGEEEKLLYSSDSGKTYLTADDKEIWNPYYFQFLFDKNPQYILAWTTYRDKGYLLMSNEAGKPFSRSIIKSVDLGYGTDRYEQFVEFYRYNPIRIALDDSVSGKWYHSIGRNLYRTEDFGQSWDLIFQAPHKITGIAKPSMSDSLFVATPHFVYTLSDTVKIIQSLLPEKNVNYYPLNVGNRWFYKELGISCGYDGCDSYTRLIKVKVSGEITKPNNRRYRVVEHFRAKDNVLIETEYLRIDSSTARVYAYTNEGSEILKWDFAMTVNDSLTFRDGYPEYQSLTLTQQDRDTVFSKWVATMEFEQYNLGIPYYRFAKGFGLIYRWHEFDFGNAEMHLQGAVIDGVVYGDTLLVGIDEAEQTQPNTITLHQNYPNPFNPSTTIVYELPRRAQVKIEIFDSSGRRVATLFDAPQNPGRHELNFNATHLASGVYYYRLKAGQFMQTKKMLLVK